MVFLRELSVELIARRQVDQAMRLKAAKSAKDWDESIDQNNERRLKEIVDEVGWPTISLVGAEASNAAWLIVQHASDIQFMEHCLRLMKSSRQGDVIPANIAYLEDRVRMYRGEPQLYGTQWKGPRGNATLYDLAYPDTVEARRASMGLTTLAMDKKALDTSHK